jgi:hypothetical protein
MQTECIVGVVFKFCRPSGTPARQPSPALASALRQLSEAEEMEPLLSKARAGNSNVVIEVFHAKDGQPLLIYPKLQNR